MIKLKGAQNCTVHYHIQFHSKHQQVIEDEVYAQSDIEITSQLSAEGADQRDFESPAFTAKKSNGMLQTAMDLCRLNVNLETRPVHLNTGTKTEQYYFFCVWIGLRPEHRVSLDQVEQKH